MSTEGKTLFQEKADAYQNAQNRTKKAEIGRGLSLAAAGVILLLALWGYRWLGGPFGPLWTCGIHLAFVGFVGTIVAGIIWVIFNALRPARVVICPKCDTEHPVLRNTRKYMCTHCRALLLLGDDVEKMPQLSACPYCGLQTAVTDDHGRFICPNCGIVREPGGIGGQVETQPCPECEQAVPEGAIYCKSCGSILKCDFSQPVQGDPVLAYDQDWRIGKDAAGHYYFARALLKGIRKEIEKGDIMETEGIEARNIALVHPLLDELGDALVSIEEAWQDPTLRTSVEAILSEVDLIYALLLELKFAYVQTLPLEAKLAKGTLAIIAGEPDIAARRRVEAMIGSSLESSGSIGKWSEGLVDVEIAKDYIQVKGYEKLKTEVARFRAWKGYQAQEAPPHIGTSPPEKAVCPQCGGEVRPGKNFCNTCGARLEWQSDNTEIEEGRSTTTIEETILYAFLIQAQSTDIPGFPPQWEVVVTPASQRELEEKIRSEAGCPGAKVVIVTPEEWNPPELNSLSQQELKAKFPKIHTCVQKSMAKLGLPKMNTNQLINNGLLMRLPASGKMFLVYKIKPGVASRAPSAAFSRAPLQARETSGLAIASLVLGIAAIPLGCCYGGGALFGIAALITGLIGHRRIKESGGAQSGEGMVLAGTILGGVSVLVGFAWIAFLALGLVVQAIEGGF